MLRLVMSYTASIQNDQYEPIRREFFFENTKTMKRFWIKARQRFGKYGPVFLVHTVNVLTDKNFEKVFDDIEKSGIV